MGLGGTAKKIQQMVDMAEKLYERLNEVKEQLAALRATVEDTGTRVEHLERENAEQRALLAALAEEEGIDVESVLDGVGETGANGTGAGETEADAGEAADSTPSEAVDNNP